MHLIEKVTDRIVYGNDSDWNMNIHHFDWVPGVGLYGIWKAYEKTKKPEYIEFLKNWADKHLIEAYDKKTINSTIPCLTILELYLLTGNAEYIKVCEDIAEYIVYQAPVTVDGGLEHTVTEEVPGFGNQMWADTLFMACLFVCKIGKVINRQDYVDFAIKQLKLHHQYLWNEEEGLFYHGWNGNDRNHMSGIFWGRANAWIIYSTVQILEETGDFEGRAELISRIEKHIKSLGKWQRDNGMFGTILNDPLAYDETSASSGIAAGIKKAVANGYVDSRLEVIADKCRKSLPNYIDSAGNVLGVSTGTPILPTAERYKEIRQCPTLYGQALMILALAQ